MDARVNDDAVARAEGDPGQKNAPGQKKAATPNFASQSKSGLPQEDRPARRSFSERMSMRQSFLEANPDAALAAGVAPVRFLHFLRLVKTFVIFRLDWDRLGLVRGAC